MTLGTRTGLRLSRRRNFLVAETLLIGAMLCGFATTSGAHYVMHQGTTTVNPSSGPQGSPVTVAARGVNNQTGSPYGLMFADAGMVAAANQSGGYMEGGGSMRMPGGGDMGQDPESEACAHGASIGGPFMPDANGNINPVHASIPPGATSGKALLCFTNGGWVTKPAPFTVQ